MATGIHLSPSVYKTIHVLSSVLRVYELPIDVEAFDETFSTTDTSPKPKRLIICSSHGQVLNVFVLVATVEAPEVYTVIPRFKDYPEAWLASVLMELQTTLEYPLGMSDEAIASVKRSLKILGHNVAER